MLKAFDRAVHSVLHNFRQAGRKPLQIHFLGVLAAGLHKNRVALLILKAHDLILDRRAVARANALDVAAVQRRAVQIFQNDPVGLGVGVGNVAVDLVVHRLTRQKAERLQFFIRVTGLALQLGKVDTAAMHTGRGAGFKTTQRKAVFDQTFRQGCGGMGAVGAAVVVGLAYKNTPTQCGAGGDDDGLAAVIAVQPRDNTADFAVPDIHGDDFGLVDVQIRGLFQR